MPPLAADIPGAVLDPAPRTAGAAARNVSKGEGCGVLPRRLWHPRPGGDRSAPSGGPRLCKAVVERLTYCSHMVETGKDSYRLKRSLARAKVGRKGTTEPKGGDAGQD